MMNWEGQEALEFDLKKLVETGIEICLLFNSNCYGDKALSKYLENYVRSTIEHIIFKAGKLSTITTTSPFIAAVIKEHFTQVRTRASVNMRIGTVEGMEYLKDYFDEYYVQREFNRDINHLKKLKLWADANNKKIHLLVNSGCLFSCSGQIFHDNTVAHEQTIAEYNNKNEFNPSLCWNFLKKPENYIYLLRNTWVRPEDIHNYEGLFKSVKLATRATARPLAVIDSYIAGKYYGNLLDLLEPNHTATLDGQYFRNSKFPLDWFEKTSECGRNCSNCDYCNDVINQVLTPIPDISIHSDYT